MGKIRNILIGAALAAVAVGAAPLTAQAADTAPASPAGAQADGYLYVYYDLNYVGPCGKWSGNSPNWGVCRNQVTSVWNNGYPGNLDDVWLYYGLNYTGARRGVYNGVYIADLRPYPFDAGTGTGAGQSINDNVASHRWTNLP